MRKSEKEILKSLQKIRKLKPPMDFDELTQIVKNEIMEFFRNKISYKIAIQSLEVHQSFIKILMSRTDGNNRVVFNYFMCKPNAGNPYRYAEVKAYTPDFFKKIEQFYEINLDTISKFCMDTVTEWKEQKEKFDNQVNLEKKFKDLWNNMREQKVMQKYDKLLIPGVIIAKVKEITDGKKTTKETWYFHITDRKGTQVIYDTFNADQSPNYLNRTRDISEICKQIMNKGIEEGKEIKGKVKIQYFLF